MAGKNIFERIWRYLSDTQWEIDLGTLKKSAQIGVSITRIVTLTVEKFFRDRCLLWASALTYITMLSTVPFLAVAFAATRAFGLYQKLHDTIMLWVSDFIPDYAPLINQVLDFTQNVNVNTIGIVGLIAVLVSALLMLGNIERSINQIWAVKQPQRTLLNKITNYTTVLILVPILIASAITVLSFDSIPFLQFAGSIRPYLQAVLAVFLVWLGMFLLYMFVPETRVRAKSAFIASGLVALLSITLVFVYTQVQLAKPGNPVYMTEEMGPSYKIGAIEFDRKGEPAAMTVYRVSAVGATNSITLAAFPPEIARALREKELVVGDTVELLPPKEGIAPPEVQVAGFSLGSAFAQIPVFLLLFYIIWCIILGGAALCYSHQNVDSFQKDTTVFSVSMEESEKIGLLIMHAIGYRFIYQYSEEPYTLNELSNHVNATPATVWTLVDALANRRFLLFRQTEKEETVILARPPEKIKLYDVVIAIRKNGGGHFDGGGIAGMNYYNELYERLFAVKKGVNVTLKEAIEKAEGIERPKRIRT